jgi:hypothetical protein
MIEERVLFVDQPDRPRTPPGVGTPLRAVGLPGRRHPHDRNVLVRRPQSRIDQATLENEMRNCEDARSGSSVSPHPWR